MRAPIRIGRATRVMRRARTIGDARCAGYRETHVRRRCSDVERFRSVELRGAGCACNSRLIAQITCIIDCYRISSTVRARTAHVRRVPPSAAGPNEAITPARAVQLRTIRSCSERGRSEGNYSCIRNNEAKTTTSWSR